MFKDSNARPGLNLTNAEFDKLDAQAERKAIPYWWVALFAILNLFLALSWLLGESELQFMDGIIMGVCGARVAHDVWEGFRRKFMYELVKPYILDKKGSKP